MPYTFFGMYATCPPKWLEHFSPLGRPFASRGIDSGLKSAKKVQLREVALFASKESTFFYYNYFKWSIIVEGKKSKKVDFSL